MKIENEKWVNSRPEDLDALVRGFAAVVADAVAERLAEVKVTHAEADPKRGREGGPRIMLKIEEAARSLAVSRTVAYRLIKSGELESVMIGRSRRVPADALDKDVRDLRGQAT